MGTWEEENKEEIEKLVSELAPKMAIPANGYYEQTTLPEHQKLGLLAVLAYHCMRCNYLWFPKDYDYAEKLITKIPLPKSCARCKSKYWNIEPRRKIKHRHHAPFSISRVRAYHRQVGERYEPISH